MGGNGVGRIRYPSFTTLAHTFVRTFVQLGLLLEMELGVTGGEEDGVDNSGVAKEDLYSKPEEIYEVYEALNPIAPKARPGVWGEQVWMACVRMC